jgi:hypothetical protein
MILTYRKICGECYVNPQGCGTNLGRTRPLESYLKPADNEPTRLGSAVGGVSQQRTVMVKSRWYQLCRNGDL